MKLRVLYFLSFFFLFSVSVIAQQYIVSDDGSRVFKQGKLVVKEDVPFLTVKGNSYEMGLQYGVLLSDYLLKMDSAIDSLINEYVGSFFLKKWISKVGLKSKLKKVRQTMPKEYLDELQGIADGSKLSLNEIETIAYFPQVFFKISCSAFILKNESGLVHGRNLDWSGVEVLNKHALIVNYHKENKIPATILTFIGYPGAYTGINHKGLSMSINMNSAPVSKGKKISDYNTGMPLAFKLRNILENAENLSEVDKQFEKYSSHAWFITVGSKYDNSGAIYELTRGEIIKNNMDNNFLFVENLSLSNKGRYAYSPIWMFGMVNISRERKMKELNKSISNNDLVEKSYQILTNTENHHLTHDPFFYYSINNASTIKSCIMDNLNNQVYFSYGERYAALGKWLKYDIKSGDIEVYKHKTKLIDEAYFLEQLKYKKWDRQNYSKKKRLKTDDYRQIIEKIKTCKLAPAYRSYLLSFYYSKLKNDEQTFVNTEKYIELYPDYYHSYYNKFYLMKEKEDYIEAIVALEAMMQTSTITPYYAYLAKLNMIKMYDALLKKEKNELYIKKIYTLIDDIKTQVNQYWIDKKIDEDLDYINKIEKKYNK
ncbi:MAG: C45 family autoproteolytic acyltransferase/hydrolase [Bacteroidales bacterium]|nr:C45 family autoproteolytic acyltransferase/hydrolase [Bacteroidales bacterium]